MGAKLYHASQEKYMIKILLTFIFLFFSILNYGYIENISITEKFVVTEKKLKLIQEYSKKFTGIDTFSLINPQIIVIHYTASATFDQAFLSFKEDEVNQDREKLFKYSKCNVGTHFLIDPEGHIFQLYPTTLMARHTIGFNYTAIAIENVGLNEESLTKAQLISNISLIKFLCYRHPSIQYLIGHHEYMNIKLPHYKLYKNIVNDYTPTIKIDPGFKFMSVLRSKLKSEEGISLKE